MAGEATVTWLGHATALVSVGDARVLIDPLFRRRCRGLSGYSAVLITHSHVDHLNRWTLKSLDKGAELVVPRGALPIVADLGFSRVREVEPGDQLHIGGLDILCVPTKHDRGRWRKGDEPLCTGYIIASGGVQIHHAGDVDFSSFEVFEQIGDRYDLDATLLPIGGMLPVWYYRLRRRSIDRGVHIDPDTALTIADLLGARHMVPVHWGTVNLRLGPPSMPARRLRKVVDELAAESPIAPQVSILGHGEDLGLGQPPSPAGEVHEDDEEPEQRDGETNG